MRWSWIAPVLLLAACTQLLGIEDLHQDGEHDAGIDAGDGALIDAGPDAEPTPCVPAQCGGITYACGDCLENGDGDGRIDARDPDCLGACDNSEDSYHPGVPGVATAACRVDCFFDDDSGSGNDGCNWNHHCDPHEVAPSYYPESVNGAACMYDPTFDVPGTTSTCADLQNAQTQTCDDVCGHLVANGCDCFGCCNLPGVGFVYLDSVDVNGEGTCTAATAANPALCQPCQPVQGCMNACDACEVCIGKPTPDAGCLPAQRCDGVPLCGQPGEAACQPGRYCVSGCCQVVL